MCRWLNCTRARVFSIPVALSRGRRALIAARPSFARFGIFSLRRGWCAARYADRSRVATNGEQWQPARARWMIFQQFCLQWQVTVATWEATCPSALFPPAWSTAVQRACCCFPSFSRRNEISKKKRRRTVCFLSRARLSFRTDTAREIWTREHVRRIFNRDERYDGSLARKSTWWLRRWSLIRIGECTI